MSAQRPSFEDILIRLATLISSRSTCSRLKVGCVISSSDFRKVLAVGYNGNATGLPNKCDSDEPGKCGCFVSGTKILPTAISRAYRRWYEGEVVRVITAAGEFAVTPHHPILASERGWTPAELLRKGDNLLGTLGGECALTGAPDNQHAMPIEDVFETLLVTGRAVRRAGARHEFHGDGVAHEDVDVVAPHSSLSAYAQANGSELVGEPRFAAPFVVPSTLGRFGSTDQFVGSVEHESSFKQALANHNHVDTVLARKRHGRTATFVRRHDVAHRKINHLQPLVSAQVLGDAAKNPSFAQSILHGSVRDTEALSHKENGLSRFVTTHKIIDVERYWWSGHVYNLETASNWYSVQPGGIIAHNCLHAEENAIINCDSPRGTNKIVFCTNLPCVLCAKRLVNLGNVRKVHYLYDYRMHDGLDVLDAAGIPFAQHVLASPG